MAFSRHLKRVRVHRRPPPALTAEQIDRIIATANADPRLHLTGTVIQILAVTGLRSNELLRLRVADIDVERNRLLINGAMTFRSVPLTSRVLNALLSIHSNFPTSDFVMGDRADGALHRVSENFRKIAAQHGIAGHGLSSLRRFCVMHLLRAGIDLITVARSMGYSDLHLPGHRFLGHDGR
jgi:integrase